MVVVPRGAPDTFAYLTESFKDDSSVEVVMDRRRAVPATPPPDVERRARREDHRVREVCGCALFRAVAELREV